MHLKRQNKLNSWNLKIWTKFQIKNQSTKKKKNDDERNSNNI